MIKPSNIDFTTPMAALLSYEKARFSGYDLEASTEEPVVLEEHPDYTLIGIKLKTTGGKDILRKIKAHKNGESEVVDPEPESMTFTFVESPASISETQRLTLAFTPANHVIGTFNYASTTPGVTAYRVQGNVIEIAVDREVVADGTEIDVTITVDGVSVPFSTVYDKTEINVGANYEARLTFAEDGLDVHRNFANPGDIVYAAIWGEGLTVNQKVSLELILDGVVATLDTPNPITLVPGQMTVVPILVESASKADATVTVRIKKEGAAVGTSRFITVQQAEVTPTTIVLNPQDGHIGGDSMGLSYAFDVSNYSAHELEVTCAQAGVTFETINIEENFVEEGTIRVKFNSAQIPDLTVLNIVVNIDGLTKTTAMTYHQG